MTQGYCNNFLFFYELRVIIDVRRNVPEYMNLMYIHKYSLSF